MIGGSAGFEAEDLSLGFGSAIGAAEPDGAIMKPDSFAAGEASSTSIETLVPEVVVWGVEIFEGDPAGSEGLAFFDGFC